MFDIFISYARHDDSDGWVTGLRDVIVADFQRFERTPRIFLDREDIRDMDDWRHRILVGLRESRVLLVCLSPAYLKSEYCRWEWQEYARRQARLAGGGDTVAGIYCVEMNDPDTDDVTQWRREVETIQMTDVRPWFPQGRSVLEQDAVKERLSALGESLSKRLQRARLAQDSPGNLQRFDPYFVGRKRELHALRDSLSAGRVGTVTALSGLGGMGKTELAVIYAHGYRHAYPGGTWQIGCEGAADLVDVIASLAFELNINAPDGTPTDARARMVLSRLRELAHTPREDTPDDSPEPATLLLLDNVSKQSLFSPESLRILPEESWLHVIATTRLGETDVQAVGAKPYVNLLTITALDAGDALEVIRDHQEPRDTDRLHPDFVDADAEQEAGELVNVLQGFTMAVKQAAVYLGANPDLRPSDLLNTLHDHSVTHLDDLTSETQRRSVGVILDQTLAQLTPRCLEALQLAALMPPDHIVWQWLEEFTAHLDENHPDGERWPVVQRTLLGRHLITPGDTLETARIHRLIAAHITNNLSPPQAADITERFDAWVVEAADICSVQGTRLTQAFVELLIHRTPHNTELTHQAVYYAQTLSSLIDLDHQTRLADTLHHQLRGLATRDDTNTQWLRDLAVSLNNVGDIATAQGELDSAHDAYQESLDTMRELVTRDPTNTTRLHDLARSLLNVGDVTRARGDLDTAHTTFQESLNTMRDLVTRDPTNTQWLRDLTISLDRVGDVTRARGDLDTAHTTFQESLDIRRDLVTRDPTNTTWLHGLSISLGKVGDIAHERGDLDTTQDAYREFLNIMRELVTRDRTNTQWLRDLTVSLNNVGDVTRAHGDLDTAQSMHEESLNTRRDLVTRDPTNTEWLRDLTISLDRVGDVTRARGDLDTAHTMFQESLDIRRDLVTHDRTNTQWLRDLTISLERVGDVTRACGDLDTAQSMYEKSLDIMRDLVTRDPTNTEWLGDLTISLNNAADIALARGDLDTAQDAYQESLGILRDLVTRDDTNTNWLHDLAFNLGRVWNVHHENALLAEARTILTELGERGLLSPDGVEVLAQINTILDAD